MLGQPFPSRIFVSACRRRFRQKAHVFRSTAQKSRSAAETTFFRGTRKKKREREKNGLKDAATVRHLAKFSQFSSARWMDRTIDTMDSFRSERGVLLRSDLLRSDPPVIGAGELCKCNAIDIGSGTVGHCSTRPSTQVPKKRFAKVA